jgi:NAD+ synthetase
VGGLFLKQKNMKVYNTQGDKSLNNFLSDKLEQYRQKRNFNPERYLKHKSFLINDYIVNNNIKNVIVSLSGGVDSAVVLGILNHTKNLYNTFTITCISTTVVNDFVTNQKRALDLAKKQANFFGVEFIDFDLTHTSSNTDKIFSAIFRRKNPEWESSAWAKGQLVPYLRTPINYYLATLKNEMEGLSVICGTTNRDEGTYLGYVGKASDYIVDLQIISDLHKSEVYKLSNIVGVIDEIKNIEPDGDMYDGRKDTDVFGASYDFVELYLNYLNDSQDNKKLLETNKDFIFYKNNIENLHNYNKHKYKIGSPAIHFDIEESGVENGWNLDFSKKYYKNLFQIGNYIKPTFNGGFVYPKNEEFYNIKSNNSKVYYNYNNGLIVIDDFFSLEEISFIQNVFDFSQIYTKANEYGYSKSEIQQTNSTRKSLYSVEFSKVVFDKIQNIIDNIVLAEKPITDFKKDEMYKAVGVNPLFRYIEYTPNGKLIPHYDYSFKTNEYKSLYTLVIYLTDNENGETAFLEDEQKDIWNKNLQDHEVIDERKIDLTVQPKKGRVIIFPHYLLHAGLPDSKTKKIIRTDIMFEKLNK